MEMTDWDVLDAWCVKRLRELSAPMEAHIMAGKGLDDPDYRVALGQHQAFMRMRSFISGARKAA